MLGPLSTPQDHADNEIVEAKRAAKDYVVHIAPGVEINSQVYHQIVGDHSGLIAAIKDDIEAIFEISISMEQPKNSQVLIFVNFEGHETLFYIIPKMP